MTSSPSLPPGVYTPTPTRTWALRPKPRVSAFNRSPAHWRAVLRIVCLATAITAVTALFTDTADTLVVVAVFSTIVLWQGWCALWIFYGRASWRTPTSFQRTTTPLSLTHWPWNNHPDTCPPSRRYQRRHPMFP